MGFFWLAVNIFHVPIEFRMSFETFSTYFANFLAQQLTAHWFFMQRWSFREN
jgi:hypothetical protein